MYAHLKSCGTSPVVWDYNTQCYLPPNTGERAPPNPSQKGWYSINLSRRDGFVWLHTEMVYPPTFGDPSKY